jgi:hypothetical protein
MEREVAGGERRRVVHRPPRDGEERRLTSGRVRVRVFRERGVAACTLLSFSMN